MMNSLKSLGRCQVHGALAAYCSSQLLLCVGTLFLSFGLLTLILGLLFGSAC